MRVAVAARMIRYKSDERSDEVAVPGVAEKACAALSEEAPRAGTLQRATFISKSVAPPVPFALATSRPESANQARSGNASAFRLGRYTGQWIGYGLVDPPQQVVPEEAGQGFASTIKDLVM